MKSHNGLRRRGMIGRALLAAIIGAAFASPPAIAQVGLRQTMSKADDYIALYTAADHTSPVCKGYIGKVVTPSAFSALTARLSAPAPKGEYETTAQYNARIAARPAGSPTAPAIITLPVDRDYLSYEADGQLLMVRVGAFGAGRFSDDFTVQMIADDFGLIPPELKTGTFIAHNETERLIRAYTARNGFGASTKVSDFDRRTNGLYLTSPRLFPFAKNDDTPVLMAKLPAVQAQRLKATLRLALVIEPKAPFVFSLEQPGAAATMRNPVHYENTLTAIYADPKCALVLDPTGRVLPKLTIGDIAFQPEYATTINGGVLTFSDDQVEALQKANYASARKAMVAQSQQAGLINAAKRQAIVNIQSYFEIPLRIAGLPDVKVVAAFE